MFGLFSKISQEEQKGVDRFAELLSYVPYVNRFSYRKNGIFEIIFESASVELTDAKNQAKFNVLADSWIMISDSEDPELHIGVSDKPGYRIEIDSDKVGTGNKFEDHDDMVDDLLDKVGLIRG